MLTFDEYQRKSRETAIYPEKDNNFIYPALGLAGETGEVLEKVKKVLRDNAGKIDEKTRRKIAKEVGDVLWYIAQLCTELGLSMGNIAKQNLEKVTSRKNRNVIKGEGDER